MEYGTKTLILLDNSASVSMGNREIVKETLKYLIKNAPEGHEFAFATYSGQTELLVDFGAQKASYLDAIERISYLEKETCLSDVLMQVLGEWQNADFAMRNIVVFTDGLGADSQVYPIEEVYFRLHDLSYPVYLVGLSQQTNEVPLSRAASMARISGGAVLSTEFEDSDAEVERKLTEQLLAAMEAHDTREAETFEEKETEEAAVQGEAADAVSVEDYELETYYSENETEAQGATLQRSGTVVLPVMVTVTVFVCIISVLVILRIMGRKKVPDHDTAGKGFAGTQQKPAGLTLEDMNDPMRFFRLPAVERLVLGATRAEADIAIDHDEDISPRHCEISLHGGRFYLRDLDSVRGTYLNGERIVSEMLLHSSDVIGIGRARLLVKVIGDQT